ncbi:MAG: sulfurtransferase TusA family protein [Eubacteriales bacterium]|nr:sulfurtransferase TusA family protein [Eubacteriales bacterium]
MKTVDARGLACPEPLLMTKRAVDSDGTPLQVLVDNRIAVGNITRWANNHKLSITVTESDDGDFTLSLNA